MASTYELQEVLDPRVVTESYREVSSEFFENPLLTFYGAGMKPLASDRFEFVYRSAIKDPAPANTRGAPARVLQPSGLSDRKVYMLHAFNELALSADALMMVRNPNDMTLQKKGREEILRQHEDFGDRHQIFRSLCLAKTLCDGAVSINSDGEVLESASGAEYTLDLGVAASHKSQLNPGGGDIINTAWDNAGASILTDLDQIRIQAMKENAPAPRHIWLHETAKQWLRANTEIKAYIQGGGASPEYVDRALQGSFMDLGGYTWHFDAHTYTAADGSTLPYIPTTKAIITPELGPWFFGYEGMELISLFEGIKGSVEEAINELVELYGMFSYVKLADNPTKLVLRMGDNFVFGFRNPNAIWMPTVDF